MATVLNKKTALAEKIIAEPMENPGHDPGMGVRWGLRFALLKTVSVPLCLYNTQIKLFVK